MANFGKSEGGLLRKGERDFGNREVAAMAEFNFGWYCSVWLLFELSSFVRWGSNLVDVRILSVWSWRLVG